MNSITETPMHTISGYKTVTAQGEFACSINVVGHESLTKEDEYKIHDMVEQIVEMMRWANIKQDPEQQAARERTKRDLLDLFGDEKIHVKEIDNEYCSHSCCFNSPWLIVTTSVGPIKIGWRKHVINIDWTDSDVEGHGIDLFPNENVTRSNQYGYEREKERYIHAWGPDKAREYLQVILGHVPPQIPVKKTDD